jgi:hypothetical protein
LVYVTKRAWRPPACAGTVGLARQAAHHCSACFAIQPKPEPDQLQRPGHQQALDDNSPWAERHQGVDQEMHANVNHTSPTLAPPAGCTAGTSHTAVQRCSSNTIAVGSSNCRLHVALAAHAQPCSSQTATAGTASICMQHSKQGPSASNTWQKADGVVCWSSGEELLPHGMGSLFPFRTIAYHAWETHTLAAPLEYQASKLTARPARSTRKHLSRRTQPCAATSSTVLQVV